MNFQEFLSSGLRNAHIKRKGFGTLYLRHSFISVSIKGEMKTFNESIHLATVEIEERLRGKGLLSELLKELEATELPIYVENCTEELSQILHAKGYQLVNEENHQFSFDHCFLKESKIKE